MGLANREPLDQIKTHVAHGVEVGRRLHARSDGARAEIAGKFEDFETCRRFRAVVGAAGDDLRVDLDFHQRNIAKANHRRPFPAETVDRDADVAEPKLADERSHKIQVVGYLDGVELDHQPFKRRVIGHAAPQADDRSRILKIDERQLDGDLDTSLLCKEVSPIINRQASHEFRQGPHVGIAVVRYEICRRNDGCWIASRRDGESGRAPGRLPRADKGSIPTRSQKCRPQRNQVEFVGALRLHQRPPVCRGEVVCSRTFSGFVATQRTGVYPIPAKSPVLWYKECASAWWNVHQPMPAAAGKTKPTLRESDRRIASRTLMARGWGGGRIIGRFGSAGRRWGSRYLLEALVAGVGTLLRA
jgi:hypothetical protein